MCLCVTQTAADRRESILPRAGRAGWLPTQLPASSSLPNLVSHSSLPQQPTSPETFAWDRAGFPGTLRVRPCKSNTDELFPFSHHIPGLAAVTASPHCGPLDWIPDLPIPAPAPRQLLPSSLHPAKLPGQTRSWSIVSCWPVADRVFCRRQSPEKYMRPWKEHKLWSQKNLKCHLGKTLLSLSLSLLICIMGLKC